MAADVDGQELVLADNDEDDEGAERSENDCWRLAGGGGGGK